MIMTTKKMKFKIDDKVWWINADKIHQSGKVLRVYETTFGSKVKDIALKIELESKYNGRKRTTIRASKCKPVT